LQVGHGGTVELHAFFKVAQQMLGRHDLGDDTTGEGDNLVVEVFDAGIFDAFNQFLEAWALVLNSLCRSNAVIRVLLALHGQGMAAAHFFVFLL
jgi:hypothetical protein